MTPASNAVRKLLREDHLGASTFVEKGWNLIATGDFEGAEAVLVRALELAPSDDRARALLGWARMRQGMYDQAQKLFTGLLLSAGRPAEARNTWKNVTHRLAIH